MDKLTKNENTFFIVFFIVQGLLTILIINHWYRGLNFMPLLLLWVIFLSLLISPFLCMVGAYGKDSDEACNTCLDDIEPKFLKRGWKICGTCYSYKSKEPEYTDQWESNLPHKEEMEEEYQPNE